MTGDGESVARRIIIDRVPRASHVLVLGDDDTLAHELVLEKQATVARSPADGSVDVVVCVADGGASLHAATQPLRRIVSRDHLAIVTAAAGSLRDTVDGYVVCETIPVDELPLARFADAGGAPFAAACRGWQAEDVQPLRWLKYRLNRVLDSALRIESLAADLARRSGWRRTDTVVVVLRTAR
jgi:hypothetical protein